jgi:hypothetical protein
VPEGLGHGRTAGHLQLGHAARLTLRIQPLPARSAFATTR